MSEHGRMTTKWTIYKWRDPDGVIAKLLRSGISQDYLGEVYPDRFIELQAINENCLLNEGIQYLLDIIIGVEGSPTLWDAANARVGVGDDTTAASAAQTDLIAASNKDYTAMDATYPQRSGQTIIFRGTFGDGHAEYAWEEYIVDNGAASGKTLNRKAESKGTKGAGESWSLTVEITFS
jgi:hypothetical protein